MIQRIPIRNCTVPIVNGYGRFTLLVRSCLGLQDSAFGFLKCSLFLALLLIETARADWAVSSSHSDDSVPTGVERRHIVLLEKAAGRETTLDLALFSARSGTLRVIDNPGGRDDLTSVARREQAFAGVNGGYFDSEDHPVGLVIANGKLIAPLRRAPLLSGILLVAKDRIQLLRVAEYSPKRKATEALQSGPFLVDRGRPVSGLNATRQARRTFVARSGSDVVLLGSCSGATLAELGDILATPVAGDLKIDRALNLDGGSSSAFWFNGKHGVFSISEQKTVRNFVVAVPR